MKEFQRERFLSSGKISQVKASKNLNLKEPRKPCIKRPDNKTHEVKPLKIAKAIKDIIINKVIKKKDKLKECI